MIVTDIVEVTKSRSKIFIEEEFAFVLYKGELRKYNIKKDREVEQDSYTEIMETVLPKRAKLRSMNLLMSKEYTEKQLRDKLKSGGYPETVISEAIEYVKSFRYIDDDRYAASYIEYHIERKSRLKIMQNLLQRGISKECFEKQWNYLEELGVKGDEEKQIEELLIKRHYKEKKEDLKERRKIYAFLLRRGFQADKIRKVMNMDEFFDE